MKKTKTPKTYLSRASALLKRAKACGVKTKVNILLYAGEDTTTINETREWLSAHADCITGISAGPVVAFGWDEDTSNYVADLESVGAKVVTNKILPGIRHFHLSKSIDYDSSLQIAKSISRDYMSAENYFFLKSFSYFPRDYIFSEFMTDVNKIHPNELSFYVNPV